MEKGHNLLFLKSVVKSQQNAEILQIKLKISNCFSDPAKSTYEILEKKKREREMEKIRG